MDESNHKALMTIMHESGRVDILGLPDLYRNICDMTQLDREWALWILMQSYPAGVISSNLGNYFYEMLGDSIEEFNAWPDNHKGLFWMTLLMHYQLNSKEIDEYQATGDD